jgi:hypothetical protein
VGQLATPIELHSQNGARESGYLQRQWPAALAARSGHISSTARSHHLQLSIYILCDSGRGKRKMLCEPDCAPEPESDILIRVAHVPLATKV